MADPIDVKALKAQYFQDTPEFFAPKITMVHNFPDGDFESIEACNEKDATMVLTGQRVFRH